MSVNVAVEPRRTLPDDPARIEAALVLAARALTAHLDIEGVCGAVLDAVADVFGATSSWILLYDPAARQLRTAASRGHGSEAFDALTIAPDVGILGLAFTTRKVVFVPDVRNDNRWFDVPRVHHTDLRSVFTIPLLAGGEPVGVIGLDSMRFNADWPPTDTDISRFEALAAQAAIAIRNARLYHASEEDRRRLRVLLQEQQRLRSHVTHLEEHV